MGLAVATSSGLFFLDDDRGPEFAGEVVSSLASYGDALVAVVGSHRLIRVERDSVTELATGSARLNCISAAQENALVGTSEAKLMVLEDGTELRPVDAFEDAPGRAEWFTPWGGPPDVRSIARDRAGTVFVNVHVGGILRAADLSGPWTQTIDIRSDVHEVVAAEGGLLVAATARGLATSRDEGTTWDFNDAGLHAGYCRAVAVVDELIFLTASVGPHGGRSAIYRRAVDGEVFERCSEGLPEWFGDNIDTGCVVASSGNVSFGTSEGDVFSSEDRGATWTRVAHDLPPVRWLESTS